MDSCGRSYLVSFRPDVQIHTCSLRLDLRTHILLYIREQVDMPPLIPSPTSIPLSPIFNPHILPIPSFTLLLRPALLFPLGALTGEIKIQPLFQPLLSLLLPRLLFTVLFK